VENRVRVGTLLDEVSTRTAVGRAARPVYAELVPALDLHRARVSYIFPQGQGRVRAYVSEHVENGEMRLQGAAHAESFIAASRAIGFPEAFYREAKAGGPLATFDATDEWVEHPYKSGMALLGDAAATSDPTWGQGMALTLRDVRLLLELGPETEARRAHALPHVLADPERLHDTPIGGPDRYPADEAARQRFFALDV